VAGELESSEFHRQNQVIEAAWGRAAVPLVSQIKGRNHFDILLDLMEPTSHLSQLLARELELS
jgi:arylformamidase